MARGLACIGLKNSVKQQRSVLSILLENIFITLFLHLYLYSYSCSVIRETSEFRVERVVLPWLYLKGEKHLNLAVLK